MSDCVGRALAVALLTLAILLVIARRDRPDYRPLHRDPTDEVQPPDPRPVGLAFPEHDPSVIHVVGAWSLDCRRCELVSASWRV